MNLPNKLTVFRIMLTPILVVFLLVDVIPNRFLLAGIVFALASITDHIDGFIARKYNQVTNFGKLADPLADKILVISVLMCFVQLGAITSVGVILIVLREILVVYVRLIAASKGTIVSANNWGKLKTVSQIIAIFFITYVLHFNLTDSFVWCELAVWISTLFSVLSGAVYIKDNFEVLKSELK